MMRTKLNAIMLLVLCVLLFSGCGEKYIAVKCPTPKPLKTDLPICGGLPDDMNFAECARTKFLTLQGDYEVLEKAFDSCK